MALDVRTMPSCCKSFCMFTSQCLTFSFWICDWCMDRSLDNRLSGWRPSCAFAIFIFSSFSHGLEFYDPSTSANKRRGEKLYFLFFHSHSFTSFWAPTMCKTGNHIWGDFRVQEGPSPPSWSLQPKQRAEVQQWTGMSARQENCMLLRADLGHRRPF